MSGIFEDLERGWDHVAHRHHAPAAPAAATIRTSTPGGTMSIATLEDTVKRDLTDGLEWLDGMVSRLKAAAPGIIATSEAVAGTTIGQAAEILAGKVLPADVEAELLAIVKRYAETWGQPDGQAPAQPAFTPAAPAVQG